MNGEIPNAQNVEKPEQTPKKGLLIEILFAVIFLILIFSILNYFNIIRLSAIFPNLGFLPQKPYQQSQKFNNTTIKQPNNVTLNLPTKLSCPSVKAFCEKGKGVVREQYVGLGYILPPGIPIFAVFDGNLTATFSAYPMEANGKTTQQNFKIIHLDNPDLRLRAIYFFTGEAKDIKTGKISKGQQIAVSGKPIAIYDNNSLIFSLIPGYPGSNTPTILNKEDFE